MGGLLICGVVQLVLAGCKNAIARVGRIQVSRRVEVLNKQREQEVPSKIAIVTSESGAELLIQLEEGMLVQM